MTEKLFTTENVGDWNGQEELVCDELNKMFFKNDEMLLDNEYQLANGDVFSWEEICNNHEDYLTEILVEKIKAAQTCL